MGGSPQNGGRTRIAVIYLRNESEGHMLVGLSSRLRDLRCCVPILLIALLLLPCAFAQDTTAGVQGTVDKAILDNIPKGRSFESMIPFAPGARQEPLQGGNGFQIDGASDSENVYLIDGINTTNIANGGVGKSFQMDFVQEVQVKSSSFEAEHGGALGGVINVVPKHGSNDYHGSLF